MLGIIDNNRKLIGSHVIGAPHHKISCLNLKALTLMALQTIDKADRARIGTHAPSARRAPPQPSAAGTTIYRPFDTMQRRVSNFLAGTGTGVGVASINEEFERLPIALPATALVEHRSGPLKAKGFEQAKDVIGMGLTASHAIDVLDAYQPRAAMRTCVEITPQRCNERPEMQRSGRGGRKTSYVVDRAQVFSGWCDKDARVSFQPTHRGTR